MMVRKISIQVREDLLQKDLERYRQRAMELGSTDARVITTDDVIIDERVVAKCAYPKCSGYGTNANCPPYAMGIDQLRKIVDKFRYGIFINLRVPSPDIAGEKSTKKKRRPYQRKLTEIVSRIETEAFNDGYHLAVGFGTGSCKSLFCPDTDCIALIPGKQCAHVYKARSSMEAVGMDAFTMATKLGWEIYPIGRSTPPEEVPYGSLLGLALIY
jgi:predicted metal-binding protein